MHLATFALLVGAAVSSGWTPGAWVGDEDAYEEAAATVLEEQVEATMELLCSPYLEGRDSPSDGLRFAAEHIAARFAAEGLEPPPGMDDHFHGYVRRLEGPDPAKCSLAVSGGEGPVVGEFGVDFVPLPQAQGDATGPLVWCGYGIDVRGFDELKKLDLKGAVAVFAEGEPNHPRVLDGPELTPAANVYRKLERLSDLGAVGALVVRRDPPGDVPRPEGWPEQQPLGYRYSWASWNLERPDSVRTSPIPALEISERLARAIVGDAYDSQLSTTDERGKPGVGVELESEARLSSSVRESGVELRNVLGFRPGRDPELADEIVVVGAHFDHIGVDRRGRIGTGADDNASGTAALLELAEVFGQAPTRRSLLLCAFSSEEDGLIGSQSLVADIADGAPVDLGQVVAMVNLDMVGRGSAKRVNAIGGDRSKDLARHLKAARRLTKTGITKIVTDEGQELWQRSDHYPFADAGVPAIFLFEQTPISDNKDYHTWRDTVERVDTLKITRTARLAANLVWLLGEDDERPSLGR